LVTAPPQFRHLCGQRGKGLAVKDQLELQLGLPVDVLSAANEGAFAPFVQIAMAQGVQTFQMSLLR
jgi:hypothetical protein